MELESVELLDSYAKPKDGNELGRNNLLKLFGFIHKEHHFDYLQEKGKSKARDAY